ncbi:MAG: ABC transporter ATP-binding protein [Actinobacteria bacterium]|nr:ABC transporter ATP-binding protein [Actinomycetota bacterium]
MIESRGVTRVYTSGPVEVAALKDIDLFISSGEMVAIMGPSGCGKTTLLNCLSGLDEVTSGEVVVEGTSLAKMSDADRTRYRARRMGFIFQAFNLLPVFSAVENAELPMLLVGERAKEARRRSMQALEIVGLSPRAAHRPAELSGGEQQRVAIARAIAHGPAVLWADEPTGNLDTENASMIIDLLVRLNRETGLTVVMVTHDPVIGSRANRVITMKDGRIVVPDDLPEDEPAEEESAEVAKPKSKPKGKKVSSRKRS